MMWKGVFLKSVLFIPPKKKVFFHLILDNFKNIYIYIYINTGNSTMNLNVAIIQLEQLSVLDILFPLHPSHCLPHTI